MMDVIRKYPSRNEVSALKLEQTVKAALDAQWNRLEFGKIVNKVCIQLFLTKVTQKARSCTGYSISSIATAGYSEYYRVQARHNGPHLSWKTMASTLDRCKPSAKRFSIIFDPSA